MRKKLFFVLIVCLSLLAASCSPLSQTQVSVSMMKVEEDGTLTEVVSNGTAEGQLSAEELAVRQADIVSSLEELDYIEGSEVVLFYRPENAELLCVQACLIGEDLKEHITEIVCLIDEQLDACDWLNSSIADHTGQIIYPIEYPLYPDDCVLDEFPGGIDPVLRVNGELYHWYGVSLLSSGNFEVLEDGSWCWHTYLPEGYEPAGEISSVTEDVPTEEFQIQAGIPFTGTVYTNPEAPLVVYACISSGWTSGGHHGWDNDYVRFISEQYQSGLIRLDGKLYWFAVGQGEYSELVEELPERYVSAGTIQNIIQDRIPSNDLEVNDTRDTYDKSLWGREIFRDPGDNSVIYIYEEQYWQEGSYPAWRACHLWEGEG